MLVRMRGSQLKNGGSWRAETMYVNCVLDRVAIEAANVGVTAIAIAAHS